MNPTTIVVLIAVAVLFLALWWFRRPDIDSAKAHQMVGAGALLVDVRSPGEYAAGHVDGARNIPVDQIGGHADELRGHPVIVYCASGVRSAMARRSLQAAGLTEVYNLGAMSNW
jgi:phage shock protein E